MQPGRLALSGAKVQDSASGGELIGFLSLLIIRYPIVAQRLVERVCHMRKLFGGMSMYSVPLLFFMFLTGSGRFE